MTIDLYERRPRPSGEMSEATGFVGFKRVCCMRSVLRSVDPWCRRHDGGVPERQDSFRSRARASNLCCRLRISLTQPVAGNFIMVKLIDQEDLMDEFDDQGPPNIDMTYVRCEGNFVEVPPFVYLA